MPLNYSEQLCLSFILLLPLQTDISIVVTPHPCTLLLILNTVSKELGRNLKCPVNLHGTEICQPSFWIFVGK